MLPLLNRTAIIVRPKDAFLNWAVEVFRDEVEPPTRADVEEAFLQKAPNVYLIPYVEEESVLVETMGDFCGLIFDSELESWCTDIGAWPNDRDWNRFQDWFEWQALDGVYDTFDHPLGPVEDDLQ